MLQNKVFFKKGRYLFSYKINIYIFKRNRIYFNFIFNKMIYDMILIFIINNHIHGKNTIAE